MLKFTNTLGTDEKASITNVLITEISNSRGMDNCVIDTIQCNAMQCNRCNAIPIQSKAMQRNTVQFRKRSEGIMLKNARFNDLKTKERN